MYSELFKDNIITNVVCLLEAKDMTQVKIISARHLTHLEEMANKWLSEAKISQVQDIKLSVRALGEADNYYIAMIIYKG